MKDKVGKIYSLASSIAFFVILIGFEFPLWLYLTGFVSFVIANTILCWRLFDEKL